MSRWLRNVNALLENLNSTAEETVDGHRLNHTLAEAAWIGIDGGASAAAEGVQGLLQGEVQGVDDILAKRGLVSDTAFDEFNFGGSSETVDEKRDEKQKDNFGDAEYVSASAERKNASSRDVSFIADGASLKEMRKLRRHVLQLNSDLESAEREIEAQRQELDRAASRMERDRSRHKQEKEAADASHKTEVLALKASHERAMRQIKESNDAALREMEDRVTRAEQQRAKEGGERDADLADALERERIAVATTARLQEEKATLNERMTSLTNETSRLETRLNHAISQLELASERERNAEEQLDKALSLHARQLGMRQRRESELEQTVADLAAALVVAKNKVEAAMKSETILDEGESDSKEDPLDLKARLQDSQDEIETLRAQVSLERRRCSTLHEELQDMSKVQNDELSGAHAKQRQYERKISDLTTMVAKLRDDGDTDGATSKELTSSSDVKYADSEKKETGHLRKQIASLSEKIFEEPSKIDKKRKRQDAMQSLAKRFMQSQAGDEDYNQWISSEGACQRTVKEDAKDIQAMTFAISRGDSTRAASVISYFLNQKSNKDIKHKVLADISNRRVYEQIVLGLKHSISHHTSSKGGTRSISAETFVKNVVVASVFHMVAEGLEVPVESVIKHLGTTKRQINYAIDEIKSLMRADRPIKGLEKRMTRCDKVIDKLDPYVFDFLTNDEFTRVDTTKKQRAIVEPRSGNTCVVPMRTWKVLSRKKQFDAFKESAHYCEFQRSHDCATVGFTTFQNVLRKVGTFVTNPNDKESAGVREMSGGQRVRM